MLKKNLAVIPARAGSTRIKNKNTVDLIGKPLISWTIEAAINSKAFDLIVVTTDCEIVKKTCSQYKEILVLNRTKYLDDHTPSSLVTLDALEMVERTKSKNFEFISQLLPTCPLRGEDVIKSFLYEYESDCNAPGLSCAEIPFYNINWSFHKNKKQIEYSRPNLINKRSQDLKKIYVPTGAIWVSKTSQLKENKTFYSSGHRMIEIPWMSGMDIDTEFDLNLLRKISKVV
jgi:CMP-N-acetylneuraminic acid synthetase